jgi:hypothetical protein
MVEAMHEAGPGGAASPDGAGAGQPHSGGDSGDHPGGRRAWWVLGAGAAAAIAVLALTWPGVADAEAQPTFRVVGGSGAIAGRPVMMKIDARAPDGRRLPIELEEVRVGGEAVRAAAGEETPLLVRFDAPDTAGEAEVVLAMRAGGAWASLPIALDVRAAPFSGPHALASEVQEALAGTDPIRVFPDTHALVTGMKNAVFVQVRDPDGRGPLAHASLEVRSSVLPDGILRGATDADGLAVFALEADRPSFRVEVTARRGEVTLERGVMLGTVGRRMRLEVDPPALKPGQAPTATLRTWAEEQDAWCDLAVDDAVVWAARVRARGHAAELELPAMATGLHHVQCVDDPFAPGEVWATAPALVTEDETFAALRRAVLGDAEDYGRRTALAREEGVVAAAWMAALLRRPLEPERHTRVLLATDAHRRAAIDAAMTDRLLGIIGALGLLVLAWAVWLVRRP